MEEWFRTLVQKTHLDIIDYGYQIRTEMDARDRNFPFCVMSYLKEGEALLRVREQEYYCEAGDAIFLPPHVLHDHIKTSEEDTIFLWWHFNFKTVFDMSILNFLKLPYFVHIEDCEVFEQNFKDYMEATKNEKTIADMIRKNAKALDVLATIFDSFLNSEKIQVAPNIPGIFVEIFNDISEKPRADLTLAELGKKYHMNPTYISNKFKTYFGVTPIVLERNMLLERAKDYLVSSSMSIQEIAEELRFSDLAVFTRFFTTRAGVSPRIFRNMSMGNY